MRVSCGCPTDPKVTRPFLGIYTFVDSLTGSPSWTGTLWLSLSKVENVCQLKCLV